MRVLAYLAVCDVVDLARVLLVMMVAGVIYPTMIGGMVTVFVDVPCTPVYGSPDPWVTG